MKKEILELLNRSTTSLTPKAVVINFAVALIIGLLIFISYRTSHTRVVYSARFNVSLLMMTMITTLVMSVIGNNLALSLGMVGALSIVRFRTSIKDPRDTAYIFWCIAIGICCGVSEFLVAIIGSVFIFVLLVVFGLVQDNQRYLLVVRADRKNENMIIQTVDKYFNKKAKIKVNNSTREKTEFIYEISNKMIDNASEKGRITDILYGIDGIDYVNVVCQNDEIV